MATALKQPGFYRRLGLTKAQFYDRMGGRAGRDLRSAPEDKIPSQPLRSILPPQAGGDLIGATKYGIINYDQKKAQAEKKHPTCKRTKEGSFCASCYEAKKGRQG